MSFAASTASGIESSPSVHASCRTEKTTSREFFAPVKAKLMILRVWTYKLKIIQSHIS